MLNAKVDHHIFFLFHQISDYSICRWPAYLSSFHYNNIYWFYDWGGMNGFDMDNGSTQCMHSQHAFNSDWTVHCMYLNNCVSPLQLEGGNLVYRINLGDREESVAMTTSQVNDALWHVFTADRIALSLSLSLDSTSLNHTLSSANLTLDIDPSQVYAGGFPMPESNDIITNAYLGCLEDIRINRHTLPTSGSNEFASVTFSGSSPISYRCALRACSPNPCGEGANCTEVGSTGYRCQCSDGSVTQTRPCPTPTPPPSFRLVIVVAPILGGVILCAIVTLLGE